MMTPSEQLLWESLMELDRAAKSMSDGGSRPNLLPLFERIDLLAGQLPRETAPELLHYLHKKSYGKAKLWLEGHEAENAPGNCGH
jgi:hypothetical protein